MGLRVSQDDVAKIAGTSRATVSLVLNNVADGRVSLGTAERVRAALRESGYLTTRHSRFDMSSVIGVFTYEPVFPSVAADFYYPFLIGVERAAESYHCDLLLFTSASTSEGARRFLDSQRVQRADGCILLGREVNPDDLAQLNRARYPYVSVGRRDDAAGPVPSVGADYITGTRQLTERALWLGHRRFVYVAHGSIAESMRDRYRGFCRALEQGPGGTSHERVGGLSASALLARSAEARATCLMFEEATDGEAFARLCLRKGVAIGADISLVLLKEPQGRLTRIEFTHLNIPRIEIGRQAFELLHRRIAADVGTRLEGVQTLLPTTIVSGTTLGPVPGVGLLGVGER